MTTVDLAPNLRSRPLLAALRDLYNVRENSRNTADGSRVLRYRFMRKNRMVSWTPGANDTALCARVYVKDFKPGYDSPQWCSVGPVNTVEAACRFLEGGHE